MAINTQFTVIFFLLVSQVSAGGIFEMRVEKFQLDENFPASKCCTQNDDGVSEDTEKSFTACLAKCQFLIRVCLDKYEPIWNAEKQPECVLGKKTVPLPLTQLKKPLANITFRVPALWRENFSLILDVMHAAGDEQVLIFRLPSNEVDFTSEHSWKVKSFGSRAAPSYGKSHSDLVPTHRGIGLSILTTFNFKCAPGYFGQLCDTTCDPKSNQEDCENEILQCPEGYEGEHCDIPICSSGCRNGDCVEPDTCKCHQGWSGEDCSECKAYPGCKHGKCALDPKLNKTLPFTCACEEGWGGMLCDIDLQFCKNNKDVCKNNGKCENVRSPNGQPYRCVCPPGFRGDHCEMMLLDCVVHGCKNGGQCTQHMDGQSRCICPKGFYGSLCEFNQTICSENPCQAPNSVCHPLSRPKNGRQFYCSCPPGYTGDNCEINIDDCASKPCQNGAFCEDLISSYRCICPVGFFGIWCENRVVECPTGLCPKESSCYQAKDGSYKCSSTLISALQKRINPTSGENLSSLTSAQPLNSDKRSIVMVHFQPSFLGLTIGIPVAIALSGVVLAVAVCLFMAACLWRREKRQSQKSFSSSSNFSPKIEEDPNDYASETSTIWSAYEPLNPMNSKDCTLSKHSNYPKYKGVNAQPKTMEQPSVYHQQRYCEVPTSRAFSTQMTSTQIYEAPGPALPPRPSKYGPIISYRPTFLRPILYPFAHHANLSANSTSDVANTSRRKDTIFYAILRPGDLSQSVYTTLPLNRRSSDSENRCKESSQLAITEAKHKRSSSMSRRIASTSTQI
nr:neurogenic locus protein delta [Hymenolepis microstoma]